VYGLHPMLVEPVTWIGCQVDLTAMFFMLLGLILNAKLKQGWPRALGVALCFFLCACSKESALSFPFLMLLFDWFRPGVARCVGIAAQFRELMKQQWIVYALTFAAGVCYLVLRHIALGAMVPFLGNQGLPTFAHAQEISFLYMRFWRMLIWPTNGLSPVHPVPLDQFLHVDASSVFDVVLSAIIVLIGIVCTLRRYYVGALIMGVTFALLPVLHILPVGYDQSLYHERYAMPALAMLCAWLPALLLSMPVSAKLHRIVTLVGFIAAILWVSLSALNVRVTIPLWSTPLNLWQWAYSMHPESIEVDDALISTYMDMGYDDRAWAVIDRVVADKIPCTNCLLNAASLAIEEQKLDRAAYFLNEIKNSPDLNQDKVTSRFYLTTLGQLELLQGDAVQAEKSARGAIGIDKLDPNSHLLLAMALAKQGRLDEANVAANDAVTLSAPDEREERRQLFANWLRRIQVAK
jgi:hypothetical protein